MKLDSKIFRAYDIRGIAMSDFDEDGFFLIAAAFGQYVSVKFNKKSPKIFVSGDARVSMGQLYPAVIAGLRSCGCSVTWGGSIPTPMNYFALHFGKYDACMQISASHNPPEYNGIKLTDKNGPVCGEEIQKIRKLTECVSCHSFTNNGTCEADCEPIETTQEYMKKIKSIIPKLTSKKIIVDCGNAIPGAFYPQMFEEFGQTVEQLYCDLNMNFPNHQPDPERPENLMDLILKIKESNADFGFAFDGDGDRLGIVLPSGQILSAAKILYCLASDFLSRNKGAKIVMDAMTSSVLAQKIKEKGGVPIFSKTGHSYIEEKMEEVGSLLAGEQSGHFMFGENYYGNDDAFLAGLRFLQAIENNSELLYEVTAGWENLFEISEKIHVPDNEKFEVLEKIKKEVLEKYPDALTLDGIRINFNETEWAIIRCSNTSPKIALLIEAKTQDKAEQIKSYFMEKLEKFS